jgi:hypothetical protein
MSIRILRFPGMLLGLALCATQVPYTHAQEELVNLLQAVDPLQPVCEGVMRSPRDGEVFTMAGNSYEFHADLDRFEAVPNRPAPDYKGPLKEGCRRINNGIRQRWSASRMAWETDS